MARPTPELIEALRSTARSLSRANDYQWGHMGACNCGFLARQVTHIRKEEIHNWAMQRSGDWSEQLNDYCPDSGLPMDILISELINFGFSLADLKHLERLSDPEILREFPTDKRNLHHNVKEDVIRYLLAWADQLERACLSKITLPPMHPAELHPA